MPLPQDSLNQMLEITEFLAWAYEIKRNFCFYLFEPSPYSHLIVLVLWMVTFQDSNIEGNDYLIPCEIVIF